MDPGHPRRVLSPALSREDGRGGLRGLVYRREVGLEQWAVKSTAVWKVLTKLGCRAGQGSLGAA